MFHGAQLGGPTITHRPLTARPGAEQRRLLGPAVGAPVTVRVVDRASGFVARTRYGYAEKPSTRRFIATDVAARGIHVDGVSLVVHVDPPRDSKDYLHRAGRTARAGESGTVVTLVLPQQRAGTYSLVAKAGVVAGRTKVTSTGPELTTLIGAQV